VPFQAGEPSWSPDGDRIAFTRAFSIDTSDVYVVDADGSNLRRLTRRSRRSPGSNSPAWSPDGSVIAFVRWPDQHNDLYTGAEIYLVDAAGGRPRRVTSSPPDSPGDFGPAWSPDRSASRSSASPPKGARTSTSSVTTEATCDG
jgi:TolB protein